jgi:hypothetical protein
MSSSFRLPRNRNGRGSSSCVHRLAPNRAMLRRCVRQPLQAHRDTLKCRNFRADAAFANPEIHEFLEAEGIGYAIRLPANRVARGSVPRGGTRSSNPFCSSGESCELQSVSSGAPLQSRATPGVQKGRACESPPGRFQYSSGNRKVVALRGFGEDDCHTGLRTVKMCSQSATSSG